MNKENFNIAVVGLGYVGLPLAVQLAKRYTVTGFDLNPRRVAELRNGRDRTNEIGKKQLSACADKLTYSTAVEDIADKDLYVVAVPTPITANNAPDLQPLANASRTVGQAISGSALKPTVVFESTVYPGCTEDYCVPIIEEASGLAFNREFFVGYSPERINPGDTDHTVDKIVKVTSGSTPEAADLIDQVYGSVISAGTYRAPSIQVAEAAKVIENTQRDLNIAFVNELAVMFARMGLDTSEVLIAAGTKWNFLQFRPGLVGGHCIGVDPYYLTYKAQEVGHHPEIILAGRRLNDGMGAYVASELVKLMIQRGVAVAKSRVLVLGITFKENCPDIRNTKVVDLVQELTEYGCQVSIHDPWADGDEVFDEYRLELLSSLEGDDGFDGVVLCVGHREFLQIDPRSLVADHGAIYDVKSFWSKDMVDKRL